MMDILLQKPVSVQRLVLLWLWLCMELAGVWASEDVYFDKYGDCSRGKPFELQDDTYDVYHKGGGYNHESLRCALTFKAAPKFGICMTFKDFFIDDCSVQLLIFKSKDHSGELWKELSCHTRDPSEMCTSERYVTLRVVKSKLNKNKGYGFEIEIEQSSSVTDEGMLFASIGFIVGIIGGVVVLLVIIAFVVYCCCRKKGDASTGTNKHAMSPSDQVQPSAPPLLEAGDHSHSGPAMHLYPHLQLQQETPMLDPPPPYDNPPSYSPQHT